jgi:uncharacterized Zn finger protein
MGKKTENGYYYSKVKKKLRDRSEEELLELLAETAEHNWEVGRFILERAMMNAGDIKNLVKSLRSEISKVTSQSAWSREWSDEKRLPDYSYLQTQFDSLEKRGCGDVLLELGEELWKLGNDQLEKRCSDEGETGTAIAECMEPALRALPKSSLSKPEQLLWAIEKESMDNYGILSNDYFKFMESDDYSKADWQEVARVLESRIAAMGHEWFRYGFVNWLLRAYEAGGLEDRVVPLLQNEGDYVGLVDALLKEGRREEAKKSCLLGYEEYLKKGHSAFETLRDRLTDMAEADGQFGLAASYCWDTFCDNPSVENYAKLRELAEKAGCWATVREAALRFLKNGTRVDLSGPKKTTKKSWPLPPTEVAHLPKEASRHRLSFPELTVLIRVAILEDRPDDLLKLYRTLLKQLEQDTSGVDDFGLKYRIAEALTEKYPDSALSIWRSMADALIDHGHLSSYEFAARYLKEMKSLYEKTERLAEWEALVTELKTTHKSNDDLLKVLATVE